jgi:ribosomal protein S18 acetylase RimI-like enzyme
MAIEIKSYSKYSYSLENEFSYCILYFYSDHIYISGLQTSPEGRGKGSATEVLTMAKRIGRKLGRPVRLCASPFNDRPFKTERLLSFYEKRGFHLESDDKHYMRYSNGHHRR